MTFLLCDSGWYVHKPDVQNRWEENSIIFTQAGMTAYKKVPAVKTAEVADGTILPVDGFGTAEVDLD